MEFIEEKKPFSGRLELPTSRLLIVLARRLVAEKAVGEEQAWASKHQKEWAWKPNTEENLHSRTELLDVAERVGMIDLPR